MHFLGDDFAPHEDKIMYTDEIKDDESGSIYIFDYGLMNNKKC